MSDQFYQGLILGFVCCMIFDLIFSITNYFLVKGWNEFRNRRNK